MKNTLSQLLKIKLKNASSGGFLLRGRANLFTCVLSLVLAAFLTACTHRPPDTVEEAKRPTFDIWQVTDTCRLYSNRAEMHLSTDGRLSGDYIYYKLTSAMPLARSPQVYLNALPHLPVKVEGTGRYFSFELAHTAPVAKQLLSENSYMTVRYRVANDVTPRKAFFATQGLPIGLSYIAKECLSY